MRVLLFALALPLALGTTPAPTVPTPRPTITPAPESGCTYEDEAAGPFALDCLQAEFIERGCSMRGTSYPTETDLDAGNGDKGIYNGLTWSGVEDLIDTLAAASDPLACRGAPTQSPTEDPTPSPVTKSPTPSPTRIPTTVTPAPTYSQDFNFVQLVDSTEESWSDAAAAAIGVAGNCRDKGYDRQYDATQYVVKLDMGEYSDFYTFVPTAHADGGQYDSICEMLGSPGTYTALWADNADGPFWPVDLTSDSEKTSNGRRYPSWLDTRGDDSGKGYGSTTSSDLNPSGSQNYVLSITSLRSYSKCTERISPDDFVEPCSRTGTDSQIWDGAATECGDGDDANLKYALANQMIATCDDMCLFHPDFVEGASEDSQQGQFWHWTTNSDGGCWKPRSAYSDGEFQNCDPSNVSFLYDDKWAFVQERQATLCSERCDYVQGWTFMSDSCYRLIDQTEYASGAGDNNVDRAQDTCNTLSSGANLASIASESENDTVQSMCGDVVCYIGNDASAKGTAAGGWRDGSPIIYSNWEGGYEGATGTTAGEDYLSHDGTWTYTTNDKTYNALCETDADLDKDSSNRDWAQFCMENGSNSDEMRTDHFPSLDIASSGFTDADNPGVLHLVVEIPKYYYGPHIAYENSTNDAAEYHWDYAGNNWATNANTDPTGDAANCDDPMVLEGTVDWTVFNLGGAGGVQRLASWETNDGASTVTDPDTDLHDDDWANSQYLFGSVIRIEATQPVFTSVNEDSATFVVREAQFERKVTARIPFILQFQKTVTVTTDVDIISTKFNYKTVAAIIQSIQYDTQFFEPPYASIKMQIRTKSQYPYLFNKNVDSIELHPDPAAEVDGGTGNTNVAMSIEWLHDDTNCTFTNSDHMREGDICTQEWMVTLVPDANVCYATGEYSIEFEADCFYDKEVCYLPLDDDGEHIKTVTFTFKVQTSKFCPTVADEVDLSGTLVVTGRESYKPDETGAGVEDNTDGSYYLQGEKIHLFAVTSSQKAVITNTRVVQVELEQDLSQLVMTGYNRVPYDPTSQDLTVWTAPAPGRIASGTVTINDGNSPVSVTLMTDDDVDDSGSIFLDGDDAEDYTFADTEAGFQILLHAKAFPVNVDSYLSKTLVATLEVEYEALSGLRRRLLSASRAADLRSRTQFDLQAWAPSLSASNGEVSSMSMELTLQQTAISRKNVRGFVQSFEDAIITAIKYEAQQKVYDGQVVVEAVYSKDTQIWSRPTSGQFNVNRKLLAAAVNQRLRVEFTVVNAPHSGSISVNSVLEIFDKQLRSPSSPLMQQPIFYGSVVHKCITIEASSYRMTSAGHADSVPDSEIESVYGDIESSAARALPILAALLVVALW